MANKSKSFGDDSKMDTNGWMVTFGDLIMLLLTFFVLLLTMKSMDVGAVRYLLDQFSETAGPLEYADTSDDIGAIFGSGTFRKAEMITSSEALEKAVELMEGLRLPPEADAGDFDLRKLAQVTEDKRGVIISLVSDHLFASGEAQLRSDRLAALRTLGDVLRHAANDVLIMGHTDNQPPAGNNQRSNLELSFLRALNVFGYLTQTCHLNPGRLACGGYGDMKPLYPNDTPDNRARNRRVEFILRK